MADNSGGGAGMGIVVGAILVVVIGIVFYLYTGGGDEADIKIELPEVSTDG